MAKKAAKTKKKVTKKEEQKLAKKHFFINVCLITVALCIGLVCEAAVAMQGIDVSITSGAYKGMVTINSMVNIYIWISVAFCWVSLILNGINFYIYNRNKNGLTIISIVSIAVMLGFLFIFVI